MLLSGLPCLIFWTEIRKYFYFPLKSNKNNLKNGKPRLSEIYLNCWDLLWVLPVFLKMLHNFRLLLHSFCSKCLPLGEVWSPSNISCSITVAHQTKCQWVRIYDFLFFPPRIYDFLMVAVCLSSLQSWSLWSSFANCRGSSVKLYNSALLQMSSGFCLVCSQKWKVPRSP